MFQNTPILLLCWAWNCFVDWKNILQFRSQCYIFPSGGKCTIAIEYGKANRNRNCSFISLFLPPSFLLYILFSFVPFLSFSFLLFIFVSFPSVSFISRYFSLFSLYLPWREVSCSLLAASVYISPLQGASSCLNGTRDFFKTIKRFITQKYVPNFYSFPLIFLVLLLMFFNWVERKSGVCECDDKTYVPEPPTVRTQATFYPLC